MQRMKVERAIILLLLGSFVPVTAAAQSGRGPMLDAIDTIARAAGWPILHTTPVPSGDLDVRVIMGFGLIYPAHAVRIRRHNNEADGSLLYWWDGPGSNTALPSDSARYREAMTWSEDVRRIARERGCSDLRLRPDVEICLVDKRQPIDWTSTLSQLESAGITRLPQQQTTNGADGITLVVEVRRGSEYRAYSYWSPDAKSPDADERAAARIMDLVRSLFWRAGAG